MNFVDVLLLLVIGLSLWSGWQKGFIIGILDLAGWIGSLVLGFYFYKYVAYIVDRFFPLGAYTLPVAFLFTLILARILLSIIINKIIYTAPAEVHVSTPNRLLGLLPGFINGFIYAALLSALLLAFPISDDLSAKTKSSRYAGELASKVEWAEEKIAPIFDKAINQTVNKITIHPKSDETVVLPFKVENLKPRPDLEAEMLELVNEERRKAGVDPLVADPSLVPVARAHSRDMFARGYFSHYSPEGKTSADRIRAAKVPFLIAGENLALGQTLSICHTGLMNSPGHRANILEKLYGRIGIGILDGGIHGLMITQNFRN